MEYLDLDISHGTSSIGLVTIYRPPRLKKNLATVATFFQEFSILVELLILTPSYLLLNEDFNFRMDVWTDTSTNAFKDLLESVGLKQHVTGPTHRSGRTLDLIIDQQEDSLLSSFQSLCHLPSDHYMVLCSIAFAKPAASKSKFRQCHLRDMDMDAFKTDLIKSSLLNNLDTSDPNNLTDLYNWELRQLLDKHAPGVLFYYTPSTCTMV